MPASTADDGRHDFDFLFGHWQVRNERLRERLAGSADWEVFHADQDCRPLLGGLGNIERFSTPWGAGFEGLTLRLFAPATRNWRLYWASNRDGVLEPPVVGRFTDAGDGLRTGTFAGEATHAGRPVRVRFRWTPTGAHSAHWEQAFSEDGGASWETNWHMWFRRHDERGRLRHDDAVVELRQYTLHAGRRDALVDLFEREFIEPQEQVGMHVIGTFRDLDAPDRFVWLRGFPSMPARREALAGFYGGPTWQRHREAANATMIDSDDVLLLRPLAAEHGAPATPPPPRAAPGGAAATSAFCLGTCALAAPAEAGFAAYFDQHLLPLLRDAGAEVVARYATDASANTFPRLPVREGVRVLAWLARFADAAALDAHLAHLHAAPAWRAAVDAATAHGLQAPPRLQRLAPSARSELR